MRNIVFALLVFPLFLAAKSKFVPEEETPQQAAMQPWFTGSLLAPGVTTIPAGHIDFEPYVYVIQEPASYNKHWAPVSKPTVWTVTEQPLFWIGLTDWMDFEIAPTITWSHVPQGGGAWTFQDFVLQLEFQLYANEFPAKGYLPTIKLALRETFPNGKYQNLDPVKLGVDIGGQGSWGTLIQLVFGRIFHLSGVHYLSCRLSFNYDLYNTPVHVKDFNAFGGGYGTAGWVYPARNFQANLAFEITLTRNWAFALDLAAQMQGKTPFKGILGVIPTQYLPSGQPDLATGIAATNDVKAFIQYSIAPAFEYNFNNNLGIIAGAWFTVAGKNVNEFYSGVIAINYYK